MDKDATPATEELPKQTVKLSHLSKNTNLVLDVLTSLPNRKFPGLYGFVTDLFRLWSPGIVASLAILFNRSFSEGVHPPA